MTKVHEENFMGIIFYVTFNTSSYAWHIGVQREGGFYGERSAINAARRTIRRRWKNGEYK